MKSAKPIRAHYTQPWAFAFRRFDDCPIVFDTFLRSVDLDKVTMNNATLRVKALTKFGARFGRVEIGEGTVEKVIGKSGLPEAQTVWITNYTINDYLTAAYYNKELLPEPVDVYGNRPESNETVASASDKAFKDGCGGFNAVRVERVQQGSKVILVKVVLDRRFQMALLVICLCTLSSAVCLIAGFATKHAEFGMAAAATTFSFASAVVPALKWT